MAEYINLGCAEADAIAVVGICDEVARALVTRAEGDLNDYRDDLREALEPLVSIDYRVSFTVEVSVSAPGSFDEWFEVSDAAIEGIQEWGSGYDISVTDVFATSPAVEVVA